MGPHDIGNTGVASVFVSRGGSADVQPMPSSDSPVTANPSPSQRQWHGMWGLTNWVRGSRRLSSRRMGTSLPELEVRCLGGSSSGRARACFTALRPNAVGRRGLRPASSLPPGTSHGSRWAAQPLTRPSRSSACPQTVVADDGDASRRPAHLGQRARSYSMPPTISTVPGSRNQSKDVTPLR